MKAQQAAVAYQSRVDEIRATYDHSSREFATAMTEACAEYERAMVADIGVKRARRLGALGRRLP